LYNAEEIKNDDDIEMIDSSSKPEADGGLS
jgi:hypothetical protein